MKTLLILLDGMRPDALTDNSLAQSIIRRSLHTMNARTVMPSYTLACHMSLFQSVEPQTHGIPKNTYIPQTPRLTGLCEVLRQNDKTCVFFYNWEELRDVAHPGSLACSCFFSGKLFGYDQTNDMATDAAIAYLQKNPTDFSFLYMGSPDAAGHKHSWMSREYLESVDNCWRNVERILAILPQDYTVIITADHGGHDMRHGTDLPEDMTIPMMLLGKDLTPGKLEGPVSIKDIAPTVAKLLGVAPHSSWEGKSLL